MLYFQSLRFLSLQSGGAEVKVHILGRVLPADGDNTFSVCDVVSFHIQNIWCEVWLSEPLGTNSNYSHG